MKSKRLTLSVLFVVAAVANALACTNLIVGKNSFILPMTLNA